MTQCMCSKHVHTNITYTDMRGRKDRFRFPNLSKKRKNACSLSTVSLLRSLFIFYQDMFSHPCSASPAVSYYILSTSVQTICEAPEQRPDTGPLGRGPGSDPSPSSVHVGIMFNRDMSCDDLAVGLANPSCVLHFLLISCPSLPKRCPTRPCGFRPVPSKFRVRDGKLW